MVGLGQDLKFRKTSEKPFFNHISHAKCSVWVKNKNSEKHAKNDSLITLELFCAKNRLREHQIFEK